MKYELVIGLEVHLQTRTKSKMFCGCEANYFGKEPNIYTCPVCLGLPGALPVPNKKAIEKCIILALSLNCKINRKIKFDRKNYFYPDLVKGYQISQLDRPIGYDGFIELFYSGKKVSIERVHQEEDTGKSIKKNGRFLLDYNKSGIPLIEIVTKPDFHTADDVTEFAKILRLTAQYLGISNANMEKGQMRFEPNISLRRKGDTKLPNYKVEIKNISSISVLEKVIKSEYQRQSVLLDKGELPQQETRGLMNMSGATKSQRKKETSNDYRYFPEPDIPEIHLSEKLVNKLNKDSLDTPCNRYKKFTNKLCIRKDIARTLTENKTLGDFILTVNPGSISMNEYATYLVNHQSLVSKYSPEEIRKIIIASKKTTDITNDQLRSAVHVAIQNSESAVVDFKSGKKVALNFILGSVMKVLKVKADINKVKAEIIRQLS